MPASSDDYGQETPLSMSRGSHYDANDTQRLVQETEAQIAENKRRMTIAEGMLLESQRNVSSLDGDLLNSVEDDAQRDAASPVSSPVVHANGSKMLMGTPESDDLNNRSLQHMQGTLDATQQLVHQLEEGLHKKSAEYRAEKRKVVLLEQEVDDLRAKLLVANEVAEKKQSELVKKVEKLEHELKLMEVMQFTAKEELREAREKLQSTQRQHQADKEEAEEFRRQVVTIVNEKKMPCDAVDALMSLLYRKNLSPTVPALNASSLSASRKSRESRRASGTPRARHGSSRAKSSRTAQYRSKSISNSSRIDTIPHHVNVLNPQAQGYIISQTKPVKTRSRSQGPADAGVAELVGRPGSKTQEHAASKATGKRLNPNGNIDHIELLTPRRNEDSGESTQHPNSFLSNAIDADASPSRLRKAHVGRSDLALGSLYPAGNGKPRIIR